MVYVHIADGSEEIEFVTIVDILRRCGIEVKSVSIGESLLLKGAHGIKIKADIMFDEADYNECDAIVFPGGMPGTTNLMNHKELNQVILDFAKKQKIIAAICAAPIILGSLGLLEGKNAACYPGFEKRLGDCTVFNNDVVIDENIITSKGPGTAMAFALALAEVLGYEEASMKVAKGLVINNV